MDGILFRNKYRVPSIRLYKWDYGRSGWYFVTICTNGKQPFFGQIENRVMELSEMGRIVQQCWSQITDHFPNVELDEYTIMPDHVHGIIVLKQTTTRPVGTFRVETLQCNVSTKEQRMSAISPKPGSLPTIIRSFKSACSYMIHRTYSNAFFTWQSRYHDRIIRNDDELNGIREYIRNNVLKHGIKI